MERLLSAFFWTGLLMGVELWGRKKRQMSPATLREFIRWGSKAGTPDRRFSALLFASLSVLSFQIWECFLRFLLGQNYLWNGSWVVGSLMLMAGLGVKVRAFRAGRPSPAWHREDFLLWHLAMGLLLASWFCLVLLLPWVYYRARYLPSRFKRQ